MVRYLSVNSSSPCEMKTSPAISINRKCHSHQRFLATKCKWGLLQLPSSGCCHPQWWLLRSWCNARSSLLSLLKVDKEKGLASNHWGAYERNKFSESRGSHHPVHRMLNSLTWYLIFDVQTACSLCCKLI